MHPAFVSASGAAVPVWFVNTGNFAQVREGLDPAARRFAETAKFEPKPGQSLLLPGKDGALSGVLFGLEAADRPRRTASCPAACPACCRPAPTASPTRRTTRGLPRSPSRSALTNSPAIARPTRTPRSLSFPRAWMARSFRASPRVLRSRAI